MNDKRNLIIGVLIVVVVLLVAYLFMRDQNNQTAQTNLQGNQQQVPTIPPPPPPPAPNPNPTPAPQDPQSFKETFADNNWLLTGAVLDSKKVDLDVNVPQALTLNFDKSKKGYSGFAGCNGFSGTYKASAPDNFSFGSTISTKKYCQESSPLENSIFNAMQKVEEFVILDNGNLLLRGDNVKLEYKKAI